MEPVNRRDFLQLGAAAMMSPLVSFGPSSRAAAAQTPALPPLPAAGGDGWINLFNGRNLDGFYTFLQRSGRNSDPNHYIRVENGLLHIMANDVTADPAETGYIATNREFSDCRIRVEFKWGEKRFPPRLEAKRDNGLIYHIVGPDTVWPTCVECQIQETDCGDVFLLGNTTGTLGGLTSFNPGRGPRAGGAPANTGAPTGAAAGAGPAGGAAAAAAGAAPASAAGAGRATTPAPPNPRVQGTRFLKEGDFEIRNDWNVVEVIVQNDRSAHLINGRIVNAVNNIQRPDPANPGQTLPLMRGKIAVQAEYAEIWYRRIAVKPIPPVSS